MIKIYYANTEVLYEESVFEQLFDRVNMQRRSKILRCKNKEDKCRSLASGVLLRYALEQAGIDYATAAFGTGENGKPYMEGYEDFAFSLSHSGNMAVCAVHMGTADEDREQANFTKGKKNTSHNDVCRKDICRLGVDIECQERVARICADAKKQERFLCQIATESERKWFESLPENQKTEGFLRLWTGKESYGKRNGKGISQNLREIEVLTEEEFLFLQINEQYYLTLCMENIKERKYELFPINIAKEYRK